MRICPYCRSVLEINGGRCPACGKDLSGFADYAEANVVNQQLPGVQPYPTVPVMMQSIKRYKICIAVLSVVCVGLLISTIVLAVNSNNQMNNSIYGNNGMYLTSNLYSGDVNMNGLQPDSGNQGTSLSAEIVGDWTTDRGMDSQYINFKSNGHVTYGDFGTSRENTYEISSDNSLTLGEGDPYEYSEQAKEGNGQYWYIEDNALYMGSRIYYRK